MLGRTARCGGILSYVCPIQILVCFASPRLSRSSSSRHRRHTYTPCLYCHRSITRLSISEGRTRLGLQNVRTAPSDLDTIYRTSEVSQTTLPYVRYSSSMIWNGLDRAHQCYGAAAGHATEPIPDLLNSSCVSYACVCMCLYMYGCFYLFCGPAMYVLLTRPLT